jgi:phage terminase large subunit
VIKVNEKYLVLDNDTRYYICTGGRGSGKSFSIGLLLCLLTQEPGHVILFTRYTLRSAAISIIPEFLEKIELLNMQDIFHVTKDEIILFPSSWRK